METFSALLAICVGNSPVPGEFPAQRPVTQSFDVFFDLRLSKQSWGWWFEIGQLIYPWHYRSTSQAIYYTQSICGSHQHLWWTLNLMFILEFQFKTSYAHFPMPQSASLLILVVRNLNFAIIKAFYLTAGPAGRPRGKAESGKFFISRPITTKFGIHATGVPVLLASNFEENPTLLNSWRPIQTCLVTCNGSSYQSGFQNIMMQ